MTTDMTLFNSQLGGQALVLPAAIQQAMANQTVDEMQSNVGQSFAVVSIKGKGFNIRYGGQTTPLTISMNGQLFAAPFFDVVLGAAKAELSKTWYRNGYQEGDDAQPDCWSEDGKTPLGPVASRPLFDEMAGPAAGTPCTDCNLCPMNRFGSKQAQGAGQGEMRKGKACADTRKVVVYPLRNTGAMNPDGTPQQELDVENIKFGGGMLLRVPAASLKVFAEYSSKLQAMGVPYYAVVTRMTFDQSEAYPKFVLQPVRGLSEAEGQAIVAARDGLQVKQILESGAVGAAPAQASLPGPQQAAPVAAAPMAPPVAPVPMQVPPSNVVPLHTPAPTPMAPPGAPVPPMAPPAAVPSPAPMPAPVAAPPVDPEVAAASAENVRMLPGAEFKFSQYKSANWTAQDIVAQGKGAWINAPAPTAPAPLPMALAAPAPMPSGAPGSVIPTAQAGLPPLQLSEGLANTVDALLNS
jgi:hypothetical protein